FGGARHTSEMRGAQASIGAAPTFFPHTISEFIFGTVKGEKKQLQHNPRNIRMFAKMAVPFGGDYSDVAADGIVPIDPIAQPGQWGMIKGQWGSPSFTAAFTDNRNVKLIATEDPSKPRPYTPPTLSSLAGVPSFADPTKSRDACVDDNAAGSKNQDVYAAPITPGGIIIGSPSNTKATLRTNGSSIQRAFVVFVRNTDSVGKSVQ